ncbi:MAG: hypothetical protein K8R54_08965 [Bacteroidales bacterium]|nr:hypothetical protein [Bacteroidales bacterium]
MEFLIKIDTRTKAGTQLIDFLKSLSFVKVKAKISSKPSKYLENAVNDYKKGRVHKLTGKDRLGKMLKNV